MKINTKHAKEYWNKTFGDVEYAEDFSGALICRSNYNDRKTTAIYKAEFGGKVYEIERYIGWNLHHIMPKVDGGTNNEENLIIANVVVHDKLHNFGYRSSFVLDGVEYRIKRIKGVQDKYEIIRIGRCGLKYKKYDEELLNNHDTLKDRQHETDD